MNKKQKLILILLSFALYVSLGLPDSIVGSGWPVIRKTFSFSLEFVSVITTLSLLFSLISNFAYVKLSSRIQEGTVIFMSMLSIVIALIIMLLAPNGLIYLLSIPFLGLGQGAIDVAVNTIVARNFSGKIMNFVHAFYGLGVTLSSMAVALSIRMTSSFRLAVLLLLFLHTLVLIFFLSRKSTFSAHENAQKKSKSAKVRLSFNNWLFPLFYFLYSIEQVFSLLMASYLVYCSYEAAFAALVTGVFWFALMIGRVFSGFLLDYFKAESFIVMLLSLSFVGTLLISVFPLGAAVLIGLGFSGLYPTVMTLPHRYFPDNLANKLVAANVTAASAGIFLMPIIFSGLIALTNLGFFAWIFEFSFLMLFLVGLLMLRFNKKAKVA
ncbi:MAG: MFS transporter [Streptococcaceae bacterium]|jgi:MFS family permease|nr:MFS transporter [Streptococcaceae bacterium]